MNAFLKPPIYRQVPVAEEPTAATLRASTRMARETLTPALSQALSESGCWTRERSGNAAGLVLMLELSLCCIAELYVRLMACGLEFDRKGRQELAMLCTLGRHAQTDENLRRYVMLRLELTFTDETQPLPRHLVGAAA